jgi:hypothetical protein
VLAVEGAAAAVGTVAVAPAVTGAGPAARSGGDSRAAPGSAPGPVVRKPSGKGAKAHTMPGTGGGTGVAAAAPDSEDAREAASTAKAAGSGMVGVPKGPAGRAPFSVKQLSSTPAATAMSAEAAGADNSGR